MDESSLLLHFQSHLATWLELTISLNHQHGDNIFTLSYWAVLGRQKQTVLQLIRVLLTFTMFETLGVEQTDMSRLVVEGFPL